MKAAPTPNPKSFFLFAIRLVISFVVFSLNSVPYLVCVLVLLTLSMMGLRSEKLFVFGGDQDETTLTLVDGVEEEEDLLPPDLPEENQDPLPHSHPPPRPPRPPPLPPLASTDKIMI